MRRRAGSYFYVKILPNEETYRLYVRNGLSGEERVLGDPQILGGTNQRYTISNYYPSPDGSLVAVSIAAGGSEEGVLRVIDVASGQVLPDVIDRIWNASVTWDRTGKSFFYRRLQELTPDKTLKDKELDQEVRLHHLGESAQADLVILSRKSFPELGMTTTDEGTVFEYPGSSYMLAKIHRGVSGGIEVLVSPVDVAEAGHPVWKKIASANDGIIDFDFRGDDL